MPFAYFERLTRRQQAIYLQSDAIATLPLRHPERLRPLVTELGRALDSGDRRLTESATQLLATALARALGVPPVRVKVLAARPHARWGELHGLYETAGRRGEPPLITLWMRTARRKRVVAFRTYLRTLLHEMGHHVDYTLLRLGDSFHTQGFYQRESHLFHQLVTDGGTSMASIEEQLARMERTADDFAAAITGVPDVVLSRRPDEKIVFPGINISVQVLAVKGSTVRLGIEAPPHVTVLRAELCNGEGESFPEGMPQVPKPGP